MPAMHVLIGDEKTVAVVKAVGDAIAPLLAQRTELRDLVFALEVHRLSLAQIALAAMQQHEARNAIAIAQQVPPVRIARNNGE